MTKYFSFKIVPAFFIFISGLFTVSAQVIPVKERFACFFYQEFTYINEYTDTPKAVLFSSYIYRFNPKEEKDKYEYNHLKTLLQLSANDVQDQIEYDERREPAEEYYPDMYPVGLPDPVWAFYDGFMSKSTGPELYRTFESTTVNIVAVREKMIRDFQDRGYQVYRIDFATEFEGTITLNEGDFEKVEKLDPVWIGHYRKGCLKRMAEDYYKAHNKEEERKKDSGKSTYDNRTDEEKISDYRISLYSNAIAAVERARSEQTVEAWQNARAALDNYYAMGGLLIPQSMDQEVNAGLQNAMLAYGVVSMVETLTSSPWSYGYGQFLDAKNETWIHRFNFGLSGAYNDSWASVDFSVMSNYMQMPQATLNYRFEDNNGTSWDATESTLIDKVQIFTISVGPAFTFWPQKNIFIQITPEAHLGFQFDHNDSPLPLYTAFPGLNSKLGFRLGRVYISGTYGIMWKGYDVDDLSEFYTKPGVVNPNTNPTYGTWIADNYNGGSMTRYAFWMVSLGLYLGEN